MLAPPPPPPAETAPARPGSLTAATTGALGLLAGVVALLLVGSTSGWDHPDTWDERVAHLVPVVEASRGLEFRHPVRVEFLTPEEYSEYARIEAEDLTDEDEVSLEEWVALLRAFGLVSGSFDPVDATNELVDEGTLAVYAFDDHTIRVRGTEVDRDLEVTLVHEMVHALQDQHFDLGRLAEVETSGEATALRAVVEGDALLVEQRFAEIRSMGDQFFGGPGELPDELMDDMAHHDDLFDEVPEYLVASCSAPYLLGLPLIAGIEAEEGWEGVNALLVDPPTTERELLFPSRIGDGAVTVEVDLPGGVDDGEVDGDLGAFGLYLVLATRIDHLEALESVEAWTGDHYRTFEVDDRLCVALVVATSGGEGHDRLLDALSRWAGSRPSEAAANVGDEGDRLRVETCDPGPDVGEEISGSLDAALLASGRVWMWSFAIMSGSDRIEADCFGAYVVENLAVDLLFSPDPSDEEVDEIWDVIARAWRACL